MPNLIGPNQIEILYRVPTTPNREHAVRFNTAVQGSPANGLPMASYSLLKKGGGTVTADAAINLLWSFIRQFYPAGATGFQVTLWSVAVGTSARTFMSSMTLTNPAGVNGAAVSPLQQHTLTFRSANGGVQKVVLMESSTAGGETRNTLLSNAAGSPAQKLASYMLSADNVTLAADDAFAIAPLRDLTGQNEHIVKKLKYG
jgi:hypothetical protein